MQDRTGAFRAFSLALILTLPIGIASPLAALPADTEPASPNVRVFWEWLIQDSPVGNLLGFVSNKENPPTNSPLEAAPIEDPSYATSPDEQDSEIGGGIDVDG